ncbi:hypothetical protein H4R33_006626, partial [Dimargaris cristalligena]
SVEPRQPAGQTKVLIVDLMARLFVAGYLHLEKKTKESPAVKYLSGVQFPPVIKYLLAGKSPLLIEWPLPIESPLPAVEALLSPIESLLPPVESSLLAIELMPPVEYQPVIKDLPPTKILSAAEPQLATDSLLPVEYQPAIECLPPTEILSAAEPQLETGSLLVYKAPEMEGGPLYPAPSVGLTSDIPALESDSSPCTESLFLGCLFNESQPVSKSTELECEPLVPTPSVDSQSNIPGTGKPRVIARSSIITPSRLPVPVRKWKSAFPALNLSVQSDRINQGVSGVKCQPQPAITLQAQTPLAEAISPSAKLDWSVHRLLPCPSSSANANTDYNWKQEPYNKTTASSADTDYSWISKPHYKTTGPPANPGRSVHCPSPCPARGTDTDYSWKPKPHNEATSAPANPGWFVNQAPPCPAISTDTNTDYNRKQEPYNKAAGPPANPGWFVNQAPPCPAISTDTNTDYN